MSCVTPRWPPWKVSCVTSRTAGMCCVDTAGRVGRRPPSFVLAIFALARELFPLRRARASARLRPVLSRHLMRLRFGPCLVPVGEPGHVGCRWANLLIRTATGTGGLAHQDLTTAPRLGLPTCLASGGCGSRNRCEVPCPVPPLSVLVSLVATEDGHTGRQERMTSSWRRTPGASRCRRSGPPPASSRPGPVPATSLTSEVRPSPGS